MKYYSTNGNAPIADLHKAVVKGLAEDRGLYMPDEIKKLPKAFFDNIQDMTFQQIAYNVASAFFGEDVDLDALQDIEVAQRRTVETELLHLVRDATGRPPLAVVGEEGVHMQVHCRSLRRELRGGGQRLERIHALPGVKGRKLGENVRFHGNQV